MKTLLETFALLLIQEAAPILATALLSALTALVGYVVVFVRTKLGEARWSIVVKAARRIVLSVEQSGLRDGAIKAGQQKKDEALSKLVAFLGQRGFRVFAANVEALSDVIESIVFEELNTTAALSAVTLEVE
jgi:hypothetical protein